MYRIIGGDQKEYGTLSAEDMRKWIAEGRLNAQTLTKAEGDEAFRPLGGFPEFVDALAAAAAEPIQPTTPIQPASDGNRDAALRQVKGPAIGLKVTAVIGLMLVAAGLVINILALSGVQIGLQQINDPQVQKLLSSMGGGLGIVQNAHQRGRGCHRSNGRSQNAEIAESSVCAHGRHCGHVAVYFALLCVRAAHWHLGVGDFEQAGSEVTIQLKHDDRPDCTTVKPRPRRELRAGQSGRHPGAGFADGAPGCGRNRSIVARRGGVLFDCRLDV